MKTVGLSDLGAKRTSFLRYIAPEILLFVFVVVTLPLWLPFWLWFEVRGWLDMQRYYYEAAEWRRRQDELNGTDNVVPDRMK